MMKRWTIVSAAIVLSAQAFSQNAKHINYYRAIDEIRNDFVTVDVKDPVARMDFMKFRAKFTNITPDIIRIAAGESAFVIDGKDHKPKDRQFHLDPYDNTSKTIQVDGAGINYHVDNAEVRLAGFSRIPVKGAKVVEAEGFALPPSKNAISAGPFEISLKNLTKETKATVVTFEVQYNGSKFAIVDQSKISVRMDKSGQVFASEKSKPKLELLERGDKCTIKATFKVLAKVEDMQFANMTVLWNDTFSESEAVPFDVPGFKLELDPGLTAGKNK